MNATKSILPAVLISLLVGKPWAKIIRVPQDYSTIQSAIRAAAVNDTVLVSPGTYHESLNFIGKDIIVGSWFLTIGNTQYITDTVIDPDSGSVVTFANRETQNALLCGFTITGGTGTIIDSTNKELIGGAGILIRGASPVIRNNLITRNSTWPACAGFGGGLAIMDSACPLIVRNVITANDNWGRCTHLSYHGGGIWIDSTSNPVIGGSLENANDIYANRSAACEQLFFQRSDHVINAQYNYWGGCPPSALAVCSSSNVDFSNCLNAPALEVDDTPPNLPAEFQLSHNYPNPFNPETTIEYSLPRPSLVKLEIYDMTGQLVRTLVNELHQAGVKLVIWDGRNDHGKRVPSGIYVYRIMADGFKQSSKSVLLK